MPVVTIIIIHRSSLILSGNAFLNGVHVVGKLISDAVEFKFSPTLTSSIPAANTYDH